MNGKKGMNINNENLGIWLVAFSLYIIENAAFHFAVTKLKAMKKKRKEIDSL